MTAQPCFGLYALAWASRRRSAVVSLAAQHKRIRVPIPQLKKSFLPYLGGELSWEPGSCGYAPHFSGVASIALRCLRQVGKANQLCIAHPSI